MARREYKMINRRMLRGRQISANEGKFLGSVPPYGYDKIRLENQKGFTLKPNIKQAENVKFIFESFANDKIGATLIAKVLNENEDADEKNKIWLPTTVRDILKNPVYTGNIRINSKPTKKITENGKLKITQAKDENCTVVKGLHEPIISIELWEKAQKTIYENKPLKVKNGYEIKNPLAGLVYCGKCGKTIIRHVDRKGIVLMTCQTMGCDNATCKFEALEKKL